MAVFWRRKPHQLTTNRHPSRDLRTDPRRAKAQLMEQHTGIRDVPVELLTYIFRLFFDITSLRQDRCRLSLVCHAWRDLVQESAALWTEISAHDNIHYIKTSLAKAKNLLIDIYYLFSDSPRPRTRLSSYINQVVTPLLSRSYSISLTTQYGVESFPLLFVQLQSKPALRLESLILKGCLSCRVGCVAGANSPELPEISTFPKLRRLQIDGVPCKLSPRGLELHNVLSLNLVDLLGVSAEQLLEVLRNSPYLESLELGQSPVTCPAHTVLAPIHLPYLTTLHFIFMPIPVSNFFLSTIHAPNCSELSISSDFAHLPDGDVVKAGLFTSSTSHLTPVLRTLLTRGRYKDINITAFDTEKMKFFLHFHDWDIGYPTSRAIRLDFRLNSARQVEETVRWLGDCFQRDGPKIPIRLRMNGFEAVHVMNLLDSYTTITHLGFLVPSLPDRIMSNSILVHMAQPTQFHWPLTNLFVYEGDAGSEDEVMLDMLQRRYTSGSEGPDNGRIRPLPIKRVRVCLDGWRCDYILGEVRKLLPEVETCRAEDDNGFW